MRVGLSIFHQYNSVLVIETSIISNHLAVPIIAKHLHYQ